MAINVEIERNSTENGLSVLRRFTKRVQNSGILPRLRGIRYRNRELSPYKRKVQTLKVLRRREEIQELIKLGKMAPRTTHTKKGHR